MRCAPTPVLAALLAILGPSVAAAQVQLLGTVGLGRPVRGIDARAHAMGRAGVALHGGNFSTLNVAAMARINTPGVFLTFGQENRDIQSDLANGDFSTADFPVVRVAFPVGERHIVGVAAANFLDQDWGVEFVDTLRLSSGDVAFRETRESDGGVAEFRLEWATILSEKLSLGAAALFYSGETRQRVEKAFTASSAFMPFESETSLEYTGWGLSVGGELQPVAEMILGGAFRFGFGLNVESDTGAELDTEVPMALDLGASWQLTPDFIIALAGGWENWGTTNDDLPDVQSVDIWRFGGGIDFRALSNASTALFLRLGGHFERQPFQLQGGAPWERAGSIGLGLNLREGRGRVDASVEFGARADREKHGIDESFTRYMFGLAVFTS